MIKRAPWVIAIAIALAYGLAWVCGFDSSATAIAGGETDILLALSGLAFVALRFLTATAAPILVLGALLDYVCVHCARAKLVKAGR